MLIRYTNYIKRIIYIFVFMFLLTCISVQANDIQELKGTNNVDNQTTFQLSENIDNQTNGHTKNKTNDQSDIDLSAGDYVSVYDKSVKTLLGIDVNSENGVEVGEIKDYLLKADKVEYAVVLIKDFPVLDDTIVKKFVVVPYNELRIEDKSDLSLSTGDLQVILNVTKQEADQLPEFMYSEDHGRQGNINADKSAELNYDISVEEIIGMKVFGESDNLLGVIEDLIINNNNRASYAIIYTSGLLGISDKRIAAPFQELQIHRTKEKMVLDVTNQALEDAPEFQIRNP